MKSFKKYSSLENHYNGKYLNKIKEEYKTVKWCTSEKLDGANIQIYFTPNEPYLLGKRSSFISGNGEGFFEFDKVLPKYEKVLRKVQAFCDKTNTQVTLYGELYGKGINGRIKYGDGESKYLKFFDITIDGRYLPQDEVRRFSEYEGINEHFVELTIYPNLIEALAVDVEEINRKELISEGIVLKPYEFVYYMDENQQNDRIVIKKKSAAFSDKMEKAHIQKQIRMFDPKILNASNEFKKYITKNRLTDLFSKHGKMSTIKQMGEYIALYLDDAKSDYVKEHDISEFDEKQLKDVFNVGSMVAMMLKDSLNDNV